VALLFFALHAAGRSSGGGNALMVAAFLQRQEWRQLTFSGMNTILDF
jgi:hypothetical protein